jgi:hypothetical protein
LEPDVAGILLSKRAFVKSARTCNMLVIPVQKTNIRGEKSATPVVNPPDNCCQSREKGLYSPVDQLYFSMGRQLLKAFPH